MNFTLLSIVLTVATTVFSAAQVIVAVINAYRSKKQRKQKAEAQATIFLQKYESTEHQHLKHAISLCAIAYKYNGYHSYKREIYKEYCLLENEVKKAVLKRIGLQKLYYIRKQQLEKQLKHFFTEYHLKYPRDISRQEVYKRFKASIEFDQEWHHWYEYNVTEEEIEKGKVKQDNAFSIYNKALLLLKEKADDSPILSCFNTPVVDQANSPSHPEINQGWNYRYYALLSVLHAFVTQHGVNDYDNIVFNGYAENIEDVALDILYRIISKPTESIDSNVKNKSEQIEEEELVKRSRRLDHIYKVTAAVFAVLAGSVTVLQSNKLNCGPPNYRVFNRESEIMIMLIIVSGTILLCLLRYIYLELKCFRVDFKKEWMETADKSYSRLWTETIILLITHFVASTVLYYTPVDPKKNGIPITFCIMMTTLFASAAIDFIPRLKNNKKSTDVLAYILTTGFSLLLHVLVSMSIYGISAQ